MPVQAHQLQRHFLDPESYTFTLIACFLEIYGTEAVSWSPLTIDMELTQDVGDVPRENFDKLQTAIFLLTSNSFFVSVADFARTCCVLAGHSFNPNSIILPDCVDLAWGITEGMLICPPEEEDKEPFSAEILGFIGACLSQEGILNAPDVLRIGTRDKDLANQARLNFSDDPEMFGAVMGVDKLKGEDITKTVEAKLQQLLRQLVDLPVAEGRASQLAKALLERLSQSGKLPIPM
jgi:hypothetical protein